MITLLAEQPIFIFYAISGLSQFYLETIFQNNYSLIE